MDPVSRLNASIEAHLPAAWRCLSPLGRRFYFPVDIPAQSAEARGTAINATIGEVTDGAGTPLSLPSLSEHITGLDPRKVFLYAAQGGDAELRRRWGAHLARRGDVPMTTPVVTCGITQGLSLAADLFANEDVTVLLPRPCWGNYRFIFGVRRGAQLAYYPTVSQTGLDLEGLRAALAGVQGKAVLLLNFPNNPTGYTPTQAEIDQLRDLVLAHPGPLVVLLDDAYQDMVWEPGLMSRSLFYDLVERGDPERLLAVKLDGATKELFFFGARVGFITFGANNPGAEALVEKTRGLLRAAISAVPSPSQAMVLAALADPNLQMQRAAILGEVARRYQALKDAVAQEGLPTFPFNSAYFALVPVPGDADALRRRLISEASVGVVSFNEFGALRLGYGSTRVEDIPPLVRAIRARL